jgi:hypothetical protein
LAIQIRPFGFLAPKDLKNIWLSNFLTEEDISETCHANQN